MRILLWLLQMVTHPGRPLASTIAFVRDHPRRVTYLIWPPFETYILAFVVLLLTVVDWAFFYVRVSFIASYKAEYRRFSMSATPPSTRFRSLLESSLVSYRRRRFGPSNCAYET